MPERILHLTQIQAVKIHNRIGEMTEGSKGQRIQRVNFMERLLKTFPEAKGDSGLPTSTDKRDVKFTQEEQRAVAEGLIALASAKEWTAPNGVRIPVSTGDVQAILADAALLSLKIYVTSHLLADKVDAFDGIFDEEPPLDDTPAAPAV
jgi:hypothetical protein